MLLWIPFAVKTGLKICRHTQIDAIYTTSPPHSTHLAGLILSRLRNKPWVADFRDPWTLNAYRGKGFLDDTLFKIERIMEKAVLEKASIILANTKANRDNLLKAFPRLIRDKIIHLPNGWEEFPERYYREKKDGPFTIVHAGTFYPRFKPYALLYALSDWRNGKHPTNVPRLNKEVQIILLGSRDAETKRVVGELGLDDIVEIRPWVALEDARRIMCQADMLWASLGTGKKSSTFVPSKLFEYIAAKKPILGFFPEGESANLISETGTGIVFTNDDPVPIIEVLNKMHVLNQKNEKMDTISHKREDIIAPYHIKAITERLANILNRLTESRQEVTISIRKG
jgi:hypothetical protein